MALVWYEGGAGQTATGMIAWQRQRAQADTTR
jgi:hypothetical protein